MMCQENCRKAKKKESRWSVLNARVHTPSDGLDSLGVLLDASWCCGTYSGEKLLRQKPYEVVLNHTLQLTTCLAASLRSTHEIKGVLPKQA